jgi:hypothetical protein
MSALHISANQTREVTGALSGPHVTRRDGTPAILSETVSEEEAPAVTCFRR